MAGTHILNVEEATWTLTLAYGGAPLTGVSAYGATLIDDADAGTARATLGLGDVATLDVTNDGRLNAGRPLATETIFGKNYLYLQILSLVGSFDPPVLGFLDSTRTFGTTITTRPNPSAVCGLITPEWTGGNKYIPITSRDDGLVLANEIVSTIDTISTTTHTAAVDEYVLLADDTTAGAQITITLPDTDTVPLGQTFLIKKIGNSHNVVVDTTLDDTIDGAATKTLTTQYESVTLINARGRKWYIL